MTPPVLLHSHPITAFILVVYLCLVLFTFTVDISATLSVNKPITLHCTMDPASFSYYMRPCKCNLPKAFRIRSSLGLPCMIGLTAASTGYQKPSFLDFDSWWYHTPRGPQIFSCLTYLERNVRVDCEFPKSDKIPGPFCEFKQDGRLMGTTNPNNPVHLIPPIEVRRRSNVTLVPPNICRLMWMPMLEDRAYTYTCRVYQGSTWKENSMSFTQRNLLICSAMNTVAHATLWIISLTMSLPVSLGLLSA